MSAALVRQRLAIFRHRRYRAYFAATVATVAGDGAAYVAVAWLLLDLTGSGASVAIYLAMTTLPGILFAPLLGVLVDRIDRRRLAIAMDAARAVVWLAIPALWAAGLLEAWHVYLVAFLGGIGEEVHDPAMKALVREIVPPGDLLDANATNSMGKQAGSLIGAAAGGVLAAALAPAFGILLNAASYAASALCLAAIRRPAPEGPATGDAAAAAVAAAPRAVQGAVQGLVADLRAGLAYIRHNPSIIHLYLILLVLLSTIKTLSVLLAPFARFELGLGAAAFGLIEAGFGLGAMVGGFALPILARVVPEAAMMKAGVAILAGFMALLAAVDGFAGALACYALGGVAFQVWFFYLTRAQDRTDLAFQGRVHAVFNMLVAVLSLGIYAGMGWAMEHVSIRWLILGQAAVLGGAALHAALVVGRCLAPPAPAIPDTGPDTGAPRPTGR